MCQIFGIYCLQFFLHFIGLFFRGRHIYNLYTSLITDTSSPNFVWTKWCRFLGDGWYYFGILPKIEKVNLDWRGHVTGLEILFFTK
jgi:hypothetical protein